MLCVAQFMVILDVTIVNIAIPTIQRSLEVSQSDLQWVAIGYGLTLGGFLLLGGRCSDLLGRRRMFTLGVILFTLSSFGCGVSNSIGLLIFFRVTQGLGSAFIAPSALSTLTSSYAEGPERNKALGIWGALGGIGAVAGVLLGGIVTESLGWRWIFFINVPVGIVLVAITKRVLPESHGETGRRHFDIAGAFTVTSGLMLGVYAINRSIDHGWSDSTTMGCVAASVVLLAAFITIESRTAQPLMHLALFRVRSVSVANILAIVAFGTVFSQFFLLALFMQQVLAFSALKTGFAILPFALISTIAAGLASVLVTKVGPKPIAVSGMVATSIALFLYTQAPADADYVAHLLPAFLVGGIGLGFSAVSVQIAAFSGVSEREAGLAAGLVNTSQEIGGATMIAITATIAISGARNYIIEHGGNPALGGIAFTDGMHTAFTVTAIISLVAALIALVGLPGFTPPPPPTAHHTIRPLHAKPIHLHATEAQRAHVARHGHVGASAPVRESSAGTTTETETRRRPLTAESAAPAKRAPTKRAAPKKASPAKKATKRRPPRDT